MSKKIIDEIKGKLKLGALSEEACKRSSQSWKLRRRLLERQRVKLEAYSDAVCRELRRVEKRIDSCNEVIVQLTARGLTDR